jgi:predicted DNA-binding ribbon-helix-helix protein
VTNAAKSPASLNKKRSIVIGEHKTSLTLEDDFWLSLKEIAAEEGVMVAALVGRIDTDRDHANLSSAIRLFVLEHYRQLAPVPPSDGKEKRSKQEAERAKMSKLRKLRLAAEAKAGGKRKTGGKAKR